MRYNFKEMREIFETEKAKEESSRFRVSSWTRSHSWFATMGGFAVRNPAGHLRALDSDTFLRLLKNQTIAVPRISVTDIEKKSNGNGAIKAIAAIQILYLAAEILGRAVQHLAVTTLELFTLAMAMMALILYAIWWDKPLDVMLPFEVEPKENNDEARVTLAMEAKNLGERVPMILSKERADVMYEDGPSERKPLGIDTWIAFLAIVIFGACHLIGWNFNFPTPVERLLWRIASVCCIVLPPTLYVSVRIPRRSWYLLATPPVMLLYIVVRLYLVVEAFIGLRRVPASVYKTVQWSQFFPHI
ncbi:hypothetical protein EG328_006798 [Venturia inaequalis]|uniref:Uncharacterized protein n=1 Tax=Venturia inaequalis TaxID=5025 RepID=A0A8H3UH76_VENIN|nr:hypothetical protein EG328_006798 [Venturia inaequalis]